MPSSTERKNAVRVVVADDHPLMVEAVRAKLASDPGIDVVGSATSYDEVVEACAGGTIDVVVCDLHMPGGGADGLRRLLERVDNVRVIVLSGDDTPAVVRGAFEGGAAGFLSKSILAEDLVRHVYTAAAGRLAVDTHIGAVLAAGTAQGSGSPVLSTQELEVLQLASRGCANPEIAAQMHVAVSTVKTYMARVFAKLEVSDRAAAVAVGKDLGLL